MPELIAAEGEGTTSLTETVHILMLFGCFAWSLLLFDCHCSSAMSHPAVQRSPVLTYKRARIGQSRVLRSETAATASFSSSFRSSPGRLPQYNRILFISHRCRCRRFLSSERMPDFLRPAQMPAPLDPTPLTAHLPGALPRGSRTLSRPIPVTMSSLSI